MQENSLIKQNILKYLEYIGITKYRFYKETGITRGVLDQNNGMSEENTARFIAYYPNVNVEWLITGKGEMLKQQEPCILPGLEKEDTISTPDINITDRDDLNKYALDMIKDLAAENALLKHKLAKYQNKDYTNLAAEE